MLWRFLDGAYERLMLLAETTANLSLHIVGMELNLNGLRNNAIHASSFSVQDGDATFQKTAFFIVTVVKTLNPT
jgi:hypothetical protein